MRDTYTRLPRSPSQERRVTISDFLLAWRPTSLPDREVVDALVHPAHAGPSPGLAQVLRQWPGSYYWSDEPDGRHLVLTRPLVRRRERWGLHLLLFFATLYTVTFAGAVLANGIPYTGYVVFFTSGYPGYPGFLQAWATGLPFSAPLLAILLCHELGHYVVTLLVQRLVLGRAAAVSVHPVAFAGWVGMLVTMLNLLPISQLDGGHILYATLPRWHQRIGFVFWCLIILLGGWWSGWYMWGVLVLVLSRGRLGHPPVLDSQRPLPASRRLLAWVALLLFVVTFSPIPFRI